jgi:hypothetical protein
MRSAHKLLGILVVGLALAATGCNSNAKKIVGKWKVSSVGDKTQEDMGKGPDFFLEFKGDGTGTASIEANDPKMQEFVKKLNESLPTFKWSVKGDKIELASNGKANGEGLFGQKEKGTGTLKFEGDNLTITPDEAGEKTIKLTRVKQ